MTTKEEIPACQEEEDPREDDYTKRCQAVIFDNTEKNILIVKENMPDEYKHLQRWGLPKGKFKIGENLLHCVHREVCEEVGINIEKYPHLYSVKNTRGYNNHIITFNKPADEIKIHIGPEIAVTRWVNLDWLRNDIRRDQERARREKNYTYKYNAPIRDIIPKLTSASRRRGRRRQSQRT